MLGVHRTLEPILSSTDPFLYTLGGSQPSELRAVEVDVWDNARCSSSYGSQAPGGIIDSMICAASPNKDSCSVS